MTDDRQYQHHRAVRGGTARCDTRAHWRARWHALARLSVFGVGAGVTSSRADAVPPGTAGHLLARSGDAYVREVTTPGGVCWRFGTARVEKQVRFTHGHLALAGFEDARTHHEYVQGASDVLEFTWNGQVVTGRTSTWALDGGTVTRLGHGELLLRLSLHTAGAAAVKHYLLYPGTSLIQEWLTVTNRSGAPATLMNPAPLAMHLFQREVSHLAFSYMTGGMNDPGSWTLHTDSVTPTWSRVFDSYDARAWSAGTSRWAPIQVYFDRDTKDGVFVGWDYLGRWTSSVGDTDGGPVHIGFQVAAYTHRLSPGETVETPKAFTGVFAGDLDEMGNQLLNWQYRYLWDYTRAGYFPAIQMLGYWRNGQGDPVSTFRKMYRMADVMRVVGADMYWRDWGWWDKMGDWNGPNFGESGRYLRQYGMRQTIYTVVYNADRASRVVAEHPDWMTPYLPANERDFYLDQSRPEVINWELGVLDKEVRQWGSFQWRKDDTPMQAVQRIPVAPNDTSAAMRERQEQANKNRDESVLLGQDQHFRRLVRTFLDRHPGNAFYGCDGGGNDITYEMLGLASGWQMSDGAVSDMKNYYASYLFPPDKIGNMPDAWDPDAYTKAVWRGLLWSTFPMTGDTQDPEKLEGLRQLIDIYHYLVHTGVAGRWVRVYHPAVVGDSARWYLQRLSRDGRRGIIVPSHAVKSPVTIYPKGVLPGVHYTVSYQESPAVAIRTGADLLAHGISFETVPDGELIYLNLPLHPGSPADRTPPTAPAAVTKQLGTHMDYTGVELRWHAARDDNWISYYEVFRNGALIDKVAKGTYYFDHALGADPAARYEVAAVDGSNNRSRKVTAAGFAVPAALIIDDTSAAIVYGGTGWVHAHGQRSLASGTETQTTASGDSATYAFLGNAITWYARLGAGLGTAAVYVDDQLDQVVSLYDADEIPNVAVYTRTFPTIGAHTLKIVALGGSAPGGASTQAVVIDGFQVERTPVRLVDDAPAGGPTYRGGGWRHVTTTPRASGHTVSTTQHAGDVVSYTFTGAGVTWVGTRCDSCGMADVYVDGRLDATVDTYEPAAHSGTGLPAVPDAWQVPVFTKSWPKAGRHTIRIVVRSDANLLAKGHTVVLDAFHVQGRP